MELVFSPIRPVGLSSVSCISTSCSYLIKTGVELQLADATFMCCLVMFCSRFNFFGVYFINCVLFFIILLLAVKQIALLSRTK